MHEKTFKHLGGDRSSRNNDSEALSLRHGLPHERKLWINRDLDIVSNLEACIRHHLNCITLILVDNVCNCLAGLSAGLNAGSGGSGRHLHYQSPIRWSMENVPPPRNVRGSAARSSVMSSSYPPMYCFFSLVVANHV